MRRIGCVAVTLIASLLVARANQTAPFSVAKLAHRGGVTAETAEGRRVSHRDRTTNFVDALGLSFANTFDGLDRLTASQWPNGSSELFIYSTNGLTRYIDRLGQTTGFFRDWANRTIYVTNALGNKVRYGLNPAGDLTSLIDGEDQATTFVRDRFGLLRTNINHLGQQALRLEYDHDNEVTNRWTPGFGTTTYKRNVMGSVTNVLYPAGTSNVVLRRDALERLTNMVDGVGTHNFTWAFPGLLKTENGPWTDDTLTFNYSGMLRTGLLLQQPFGVAEWNVAYGYDESRRLRTVDGPSGFFTNEFHLDGTYETALLAKRTLPMGAYLENIFDSLGQLDSRTLYAANGIRVQNTYAYDHGGRRTNAHFGLKDIWGLDWSLGLDAIGQLTSANAAFWEGFSVHPPQSTSWSYDPAQNVASRTKGGLTYTFNNDSLNRLTSLTRSGTATVVGFATNNMTSVEVNGVAGNLYGDMFAVSGLPLSGDTNVFTAVAMDGYFRKATNTVTNVFPQTVSIAYDANGNMTNDGKRTFQYDAENRLTNVFVPLQGRTRWIYDGLSRRRIRQDYKWTNSNWLLTNETRFVYDGMLVLQERGTNNGVKITYTRGEDLSGTLDGAGGIGGLYSMTVHGSPSTVRTNYYYHCDGQGNITAIIDTNQNLVAQAVYEPFGEFRSLSGTAMTNLNRYWFSSKEWHPLSESYLYEFRECAPKLSRWRTEDPIGVAGGVNLYSFVGNRPIQYVDLFGLESFLFPPQYAQSAEFRLGFQQGMAKAAIDGGMLIGSIFVEPLDWAMTAKEIYDEPRSPLSYAGLLPGIPSAAGKAGKAVCRTAAENKKARQFFKNNKDTARKNWEERTGQKWPTDEHGNPWPAEHSPPLKEWGDPMTVTPRDPGLPDPHNIPGPDGLTDYQRWGGLGPEARKAKQ